MVRIEADEFGADLTRAVLEDSRILLSRRDDEGVALAAVQVAAEELAAEFPDVVVLAFDYEDEDEQLADVLDRILVTGAPLRALL